MYKIRIRFNWAIIKAASGSSTGHCDANIAADSVLIRRPVTYGYIILIMSKCCGGNSLSESRLDLSYPFQSDRTGPNEIQSKKIIRWTILFCIIVGATRNWDAFQAPSNSLSRRYITDDRDSKYKDNSAFISGRIWQESGLKGNAKSRKKQNEKKKRKIESDLVRYDDDFGNGRTNQWMFCENVNNKK